MKEATFTRDGINNTQNSHSRAHENPHEVTEQNFQNRFNVNVWAGILCGKLIGPKYLKYKFKGETYKNFLEEEIYTHDVEDVPLTNKHNLWYQHDGAGPHSAIVVHNGLHDMFQYQLVEEVL